jgi:ATP-dependent DNA helicase DinG
MDSGAGQALPAASVAIEAIEAVFAEGGALARAIPGYRRRAEQVEFACRVTETIERQGSLIAEAGTGTGKTVAYLVPALLHGGKVIVSTGTRTLQDQLYHRDLPMVREALGVAVTAALLKGRANYVCTYHLARNLDEGRLSSREAVAHLQQIARFARRTLSGDRGELAEVPEDSPAWALATSTRENCLGQNCPDHATCFLLQARREALAAEVVVVNHHLFFADAMLRDEGMGELLPAANTVILDEAHQLPDVATVFFGESISTGQVIDLLRDTSREAAVAARDVAELQTLIRQADRAARDLRLAIPQREGRIAAAAIDSDTGVTAAIATLGDRLAALATGLERLAERDAGIANCSARAAELLGRLERWRKTEGESMIRWLEVYAQSVALQVTPLSVAEPIRKQVGARPKAWIFASATLAVAGDFRLYQERMGLESAATACWPSPFDYANHALLYLPRGLPQPNAPDFTDRMVAAALPAIVASGGRAFVLCTSLRAMRRAHELLREAFAARKLAFPLMVQGEGTRSALLERFRAAGNAVLVASASFWEGVDVRGEALSLVVIDKLPFAPPDDPVLAARLDALEREGRNGFLEIQVPQTAITLKQGAGRLIRDFTDRGVLMICDPRLTGRPYGRRILETLPPMRPVNTLEPVLAFFAQSGAA